MDRTYLAITATATLLLTGGCGSLFGQKKLEQCRGESERLLVEYRSERDARQRTEVQNRALVDRVADLEKRLAVIHDAAGSRLATRGDTESPGTPSANAGLPDSAPLTDTAPPPTAAPHPATAAGDAAKAAAAGRTADARSLRPLAAPPASDASAAQGDQAAPDPWRAVPRGR